MRTLRDLPIKQKLLAIAIVTLAVALLLAGTGTVVSDRILFRRGMLRDLVALARIAGDNSTAALAFDDQRVASDVLAALKARPRVVAACIYKEDGTTFARYPQPAGGGACPPPAGREEVRFTSQGVTVSHPILLAGGRVGTLVLLYDPGEIAERTKLDIEIVLIILLASSLVAFLLSSRLREIIATPISRLARAAASVSQTGDYSVRVEKYSQDELGLLVDAFNEMLERVQSRDIEVKNARNSLHTTLSSIGDAVISTDTEGHIVFVNPVARSLLRWPEQDLAGKPVDEVFRIVNEFTRQSVEVPIHTVLREGNIVGLANHTVLIAGDGTEIPIDDSAAPIRDARGEMLGVVLVFRDISGRRATERLLAEQTSELRRRAQLMERVNCFVMDLEDRIVYWNPGAAELYGFSESEAVGQLSHTLLQSTFPVPLEEIRSQLMRAGRWDGELVHTRRDETRVTVASHWALHRDAEGRVLSILEVNADITERKQMEAQRAELHAKERALATERALRETEAELARVVRALSVGELATSIAHEINQPLAGVVTNAAAGLRWLSAETPDIQEARESLELIARDGNRASAMIRRIREFLKKESPQTTLLDVNEVIREAAVFAGSELQKRQVALRMEFSSELPRLRGDRIQLQQVVLNLIMNGAEAMGSTEGIRELLVTTRKSAGGDVIVAVRDSGPGISPADMLRMFDAFFTTKPTGMGMGLSISRTIIEAHGGRIWVALNDGPGLTVQFDLPAEASSPAASNQS